MLGFRVGSHFEFLHSLLLTKTQLMTLLSDWAFATGKLIQFQGRGFRFLGWYFKASPLSESQSGQVSIMHWRWAQRPYCWDWTRHISALSSPRREGMRRDAQWRNCATRGKRRTGGEISSAILFILVHFARPTEILEGRGHARAFE